MNYANLLVLSPRTHRGCCHYCCCSPFPCSAPLQFALGNLCKLCAISLTVIEWLTQPFIYACAASRSGTLIIHNINRLQSVCSSINETKTSHKRNHSRIDHDSSLHPTGDVSPLVHSICIVSRAAVRLLPESVLHSPPPPPPNFPIFNSHSSQTA